MADEQTPQQRQPVTPKSPPEAPRTPWESDLTRRLQERFGESVVECSSQHGQEFLVVSPETALGVLDYLKAEAAFDYLVDITAVDYPARTERFDLVYIVYSFQRNHRVRIKTRIPDGFQPPTAVKVHLTADWLEREVFDMFGIEFAGHPHMTRILLPEEWEGHPLRKDYPILKQDQAWVRENLGIESAQ